MEYLSLERKAAELRLAIFDATMKAHKGHMPPAFSCIDVLTALFYGGVLKQNHNPKWPDRDRFIMSKGHASIGLYVVLADLGYFSVAELDKFEADGSMLEGHPDIQTPAIEMNTGSLGHGLGVAAGLALGAKMDKKNWRTYCLLGDGECDEGSIWEAALFASSRRLGNLVAIVDRNKLQATDFTENVSQLEPFTAKWRAFGWDVQDIDGHDFPQILKAFDKTIDTEDIRPHVIIAETVKGKGVSFMEESKYWHHQIPKGAQIDDARAELVARRMELENQNG